MAERLPQSAHDDSLELFKASDLDGLVGFCEDNATFVNADGSTEIGKAAIRTALKGFFALGGELSLVTRYAMRSGDVALLSNNWSLTGTGADGQPIDASGCTTESVRLQSDAGGFMWSIIPRAVSKRDRF